MRDNTLAAALVEEGHDAWLIPTFTPIRTDENDVSERRIFFGGVNVYLEDKFWLFRHTPQLVDRLFNSRVLLGWLSRLASSTNYHELAGLTISMLKGEHGRQRKEVMKLADWLQDEVRPEVVVLSNVLLSGVIPVLHDQLGVPIVATLQGDDIFLDALPADARRQCIELIQANCKPAAGFIATSRYYAEFMAGYLGLEAQRINVVYPGLNLKGHGSDEPLRVEPPYRLGYFARICPQKGFHHIIDAFIRLREMAEAPPCVLRASGWLEPGHRRYFDEQLHRLAANGLASDFEYVPAPDLASKVRFLHSIDVMSVPTTYREPKGLYILEAWANGVPVVQPRHGTFPELIEQTGAGLLVEPDDPQALANGLRYLLERPDLREDMARRGRSAVTQRFTAAMMARDTAAVLERYVRSSTAQSPSLPGKEGSGERNPTHSICGGTLPSPATPLPDRERGEIV
jgi:glycosyltransferase involved in cell wall biosynthesis